MAAVRGKHKDALRHYEAAARIADERAQPHVSIGAVLLKMHKAKDAVAAYRRALERAPDEPEVLAGLAEALRAAGRAADAEEHERRAAEIAEQQALEALAPSEQLASLPPGEVLHLTGHQAHLRGDTAAAVEAWLHEARTYSAAGHLDAALDACQQALTVSSDSTTVHLELIRLYLLRGWHDLATERMLLLDRLLGLAPEADVAAALAGLAAEHAERDERLAAIAARGPG